MDFLNKLGIKDKNFGASTGTKWFETKDQGELKIYSPTDGKYIAYQYIRHHLKIMKKSLKKDMNPLRATGEKFRLPKEVKLSDK